MRTLAFLAACLLAPVASVAAQSADSVVVAVALGRAGWKYRVGDSAVFHIVVQRGGREVPEARVVVAIAQDLMKPMRIDPEAIDASTTMLAGSLVFWQMAIAEARRTPLDAVLTRRADWSTPDVDVYHVSF